MDFIKSNLMRLRCTTKLALLIHFIVIADLVDEIDTSLPLDKEALIGTSVSSVTFKCSTNLTEEEFPITWYHRPVDSNPQTVYRDGYFYGSYKTRFQIDHDVKNNEYNLLIMNVSLEDAGKYTCKDKAGFQPTAELMVLDTSCSSNPADGVIRSTPCWLIPDVIIMSCNATVRGYLPYRFEWTQDDGSAITSKSTFDGETAVEINAKSIKNNSVFTCRIIYENTNLVSMFNWSKKVRIEDDPSLNVTNTTIWKCHENEEKQCIQDTYGHKCNFTWMKENSDETFPDTIYTHQLKDKESAICQVRCALDDGSDCFLYPFRVERICDESSRNWIAVAVGVSVTFFAIVTATVIVWVWRKNKRCKQISERLPQEDHQLKPVST